MATDQLANACAKYNDSNDGENSEQVKGLQRSVAAVGRNAEPSLDEIHGLRPDTITDHAHKHSDIYILKYEDRKLLPGFSKLEVFERGIGLIGRAIKMVTDYGYLLNFGEKAAIAARAARLADEVIE